MLHIYLCFFFFWSFISGICSSWRTYKVDQWSRTTTQQQ